MMITDNWSRQVEFSRSFLKVILNDISNDEAIIQPGAGLPPISWHAGHIAVTNIGCYLGMGLDDWSRIEREWIDMFKLGSLLPKELSSLPKLSEIKVKMVIWNKLISEFISTLNDEDITKELRNKDCGLVPNDVKTLYDTISFLPMHEMYHIGEIGLQRRRLGKDRFF